MDFKELISAIRDTHTRLNRSVAHTIDKGLTLRNWLIGMYIKEYESVGNDRSTYGDRLLEHLAGKLQNAKVPGCSYRNLRQFRQFYETYPEIWQTLSAKFSDALTSGVMKRIGQTVSAKSSVLVQSSLISTEDLINHLTFSHLVELMKIEEKLKREFYAHECIRCGWSVRELRRQINSLYYERTGLSKDKTKLADIVKSKSAVKDVADEIRDPYVFEFLGLKPKEVILENDLRDALIEKTQDFLLELGKGFCFEARNKRILIGDNYYYIDLVLYHRLLRCNVIIELKVGAFEHSHMGQLNTYLNYYKKHEMIEGDNPPIGILLCTDKDHPLVEYAMAGLDNKLFVSKYKLALPTEDEMRTALESELKYHLQELDKDKEGL